MKSYKDVKRRIMALVVAAATILSSITIGINSEAENSPDKVPSGGAVAQVFTAKFSEGTYVQLKEVTLDLSVMPGQTVKCKAEIRRNLTDGKPNSGIACKTVVDPSSVTVSGEELQTQQKQVTIKPLENEPVYLKNNEQYSVVVTFESNMDILYVTKNMTEVESIAYRNNPVENYWEKQSYSIMNPAYEFNVTPSGEEFTVSLNPATVCVDAADVHANDIALQAVLEPAYQRTVTYTLIFLFIVAKEVCV